MPNPMAGQLYNMQMCYAGADNMQICRYGDMEIWRYADIQIYRCKHADLQIGRDADAVEGISAQSQRYGINTAKSKDILKHKMQTFFKCISF